MSIDVDVIAAVLAVIACALAVGSERQKRIDLERRLVELMSDFKRSHGELAKETRERLGAVEHRTTDTEKWQAKVDEKLTTIASTLTELKVLARRRDSFDVNDTNPGV